MRDCDGCGLHGGVYKDIRVTNGMLTLCDQCLSDINRKNPELASEREARLRLEVRLWPACPECGLKTNLTEGKGIVHCDECFAEEREARLRADAGAAAYQSGEKAATKEAVERFRERAAYLAESGKWYKADSVQSQIAAAIRNLPLEADDATR